MWLWGKNWRLRVDRKFDTNFLNIIIRCLIQNNLKSSQVGINDDGKIQYLTATVIEDDGCSHNENILAYTIGGFPNCYDTDSYSVKAAAVLTDLPSNSFARAPGKFPVGYFYINHFDYIIKY